MSALQITPGVKLWREYFSKDAQKTLLDTVLAALEEAPLYRPVMPGTGKAFSVEESNFGPLGWVADKTGYRYQPTHPVTGKTWPAIPATLLTLWNAIAEVPPPQCCLVNLYRAGARMGLHQDKDEAALNAPVVSVSLGDDAVFRIGSPQRGGPTKSLKLHSGDVVLFGGPARLAYHGIDRILPGSSGLVPGGGRFNLTLRRVTEEA
jgi:alkylated DNA repair protein (DNA oxidative demethylase)